MEDQQKDLERRVAERPCTHVLDCTKKALGKVADGAIGTYGITMMVALCPPVMLYCAGKCAVHGIQRGYHWAHEQWGARHQAHA